MKKLLGIVVLGLLLCSNAYAGLKGKIPIGSGELKLTEEGVIVFHVYITQRMTYEKHEKQNLPGVAWPSTTKPLYGQFFHIYEKNIPFPVWWWNEAQTQRRYESAMGMGPLRTFARGNKIVWKGGKKRISRKVSLEELKVILKELGFYDGN